MVYDLFQLNEWDVGHTDHLEEWLDGSQDFESVWPYLVQDTLTDAEFALAAERAAVCDLTYFL